MRLITLFYILFTIMSHSKAQSPSSSSTLPVMTPFFKPRNNGKLCSRKTSCPTSRTQLSCQGVTHTEGPDHSWKEGTVPWAPKQWPERLLSVSFLSKTIYLISSSLQGDNRVDSRTSRGTSIPVPQASAPYQLVLPAL